MKIFFFYFCSLKIIIRHKITHNEKKEARMKKKNRDKKLKLFDDESDYVVDEGEKKIKQKFVFY